MGPDGGDVRSLTYDPRNPDRIILGTSSGKLFVSTDNGRSWSRFAQLGGGDDLVLDHVVFDSARPGTMYVAAWSVETSERGELFRSRDDGRTWETIPAMHGKSIRAFALAAGHPETMVAGALDGVYRSEDAGQTWRKITPEHHAELKNFESVAIDPADPKVIYAGTWHLPWKTTNGGATWTNIKKGIIDDSDVFSIIIDPNQPSVVYASACSGIYKSENAGDLFHKIQGIPFSARRTRVLKQDPNDRNVVYAGTTEGLWRTVDAGKTWKRVSSANVIVNDVLVDPRRSSRVLLATDRGGVLASDDAAQTFSASNRGFVHRQVAALLLDRSDSRTIYAGVLNDKEFGGVFRSHDGGQSWMQSSEGLEGRDVFALRQAEDGALLAGTNSGVFMLDRAAHSWRPASVAITEKIVTTPARKGVKARTTKQTLVTELRARVASIETTSNKWFAATSAGLFSSTDRGQSWYGGPVLSSQNFVSVAVRRNMVAAATARSVVVSLDKGSTWYAAKLPAYVTQVSGLAIDGDSHMWLAAREGAFRSDDGGDTWDHVMAGLPAKHVYSFVSDDDGSRLLATAAGQSFESRDGGRSWHSFGELGYSVRALSLGWGRVLAATDFDGVIAPPEPARVVVRETGAGGSSE
ncbi:MAG: transcriptional regulator [Acidobacteriia bacterium]|nr:transcriptional regulator [Terriglobia bacterium]